MSFCPQCGAGLEPDASFCATCGTPVGDRQAQAQVQAMPAAATSLSGSVPAAASAAAGVQSDAASGAASPAPTPRRRKLPIPALVAIIVAVVIVAGVGGGVLYTNVIAPAITQQQSDSRLANLKAVYKDVLDDYESAQDDYSNSDTAYDQAAFAAKHTYVYKDRALDAKYMKKSKNSFEYSFVTLEGDDTPALLIRSSADISTGSSTSTSSDSATSSQKIVAIYVMVDGKPTLVADSSASGGTLTQVDGKYFNYSGTGTDASGKTCDYNLYFSLTDAVANASQNYTATDSGITVAGLSVPVADSKDIHPLAFSMKPQDGSGDTTYIHPDGTTNTAAAGADSQEETLRSECAKLFPDSDNNDSATTWQYISTEAAQQREELESKQAEVKAKYQVVLDDYNAAVTEYSTLELSSTGYREPVDSEGFLARHPYINRDVYASGAYNQSTCQLEYAFVDIGDDGLPELLIRYRHFDTNGSVGSTLYAIFTYQNGNVMRVCEQTHEGQLISLVDNRIISYMNGGSYLYFDLSDSDQGTEVNEDWNRYRYDVSNLGIGGVKHDVNAYDPKSSTVDVTTGVNSRIRPQAAIANSLVVLPDGTKEINTDKKAYSKYKENIERQLTVGTAEPEWKSIASASEGN